MPHLWIPKRKLAHAARVESWLGGVLPEMLARASVGADLGPIPISGLPEPHYTYDGEIWRVMTRRRWRSEGGGFTSLSDLISELTGGKSQLIDFSKAGATGVVGVANDLWGVGSVPPASAAAPAFPSGASPDNTHASGFGQANPSGGDTLHFINAMATPSVANNLLLLYDRFFHGNHNIATDPQAVTGVPTRYQDATAQGTFIGVFVTTALGTGTPTYTITYIDDAGNAAENAAAQTIVGSAIVRRFPFAATVGGGWRIPLNAGDRGVRRITNLDLSAASTGNLDVFLGKPIAWIPQPVANMPYVVDGVNSYISLTQIATGACLALMEVQKGATTATNYNGAVVLCSG